MSYVLHIVTGAPGAGKSAAAEAFLRLAQDTPYMAYDIDWLAKAASHLSGKDIYTESVPGYVPMWFEVLHAAFRNGKIPVFFTVNDPRDIRQQGPPKWCERIEWLLLDCDDELRKARLAERDNWPKAWTDEAFADAAYLRGLGIGERIDTGRLPPDAVAGRILAWLQRTGGAEQASEWTAWFGDLYAAFNARAIDTVLAALLPDVDWANGMDGGRVQGHAAVRAYWTRQWALIDPHVAPLRVTQVAPGQFAVEVHQVVRDLAGATLSDQVVRHIYQLRDGRVARMDIEKA